MGCSSAQEKIKNQINIIKNEKKQIQKERENYLKKLEIIEGCKITRTPIPNYINKKKENLEININNKKNIQNEIIGKKNYHHHHHHHHYKKN